jgi:hypothetical protein
LLEAYPKGGIILGTFFIGKNQNTESRISNTALTINYLSTNDISKFKQ